MQYVQNITSCLTSGAGAGFLGRDSDVYREFDLQSITLPHFFLKYMYLHENEITRL